MKPQTTNLQNTIQNEIDRLLKMQAILSQIAKLKLKINDLDYLLTVLYEKDDEEESINYVREIARCEREMDAAIDKYNELLDMGQLNIMELEPLEKQTETRGIGNK